MQTLELWHNISCSKSNALKCFLEDNDFNIKIRNYLENPPSVNELKNLLKKLNITVFELIRTNENIYKELQLNEIKDEKELLKKIVQNPILIQRPILLSKNTAKIVRPPIKIEDIIDEF